ncbi:integrase core domain-containing protein [Ralstonia nicotianae]
MHHGKLDATARSLSHQTRHRRPKLRERPCLASACRAIANWIHCDNHQRPHQALKMKTPAEAFALAA